MKRLGKGEFTEGRLGVTYVREILKQQEHLRTITERCTREVRFLCPKCSKGFNTRIGMENHKNKCMEGEKGPTDAVTGQTKTYATLQCETCNKMFVSNSSLKKHVKIFHGPRVDYPCQFCAGTPKEYVGDTKTNIQQHIKGCTGNPNRVTYECEICKEFNTYWPKKITEHKKKEHGWKK